MLFRMLYGCEKVCVYRGKEYCYENCYIPGTYILKGYRLISTDEEDVKLRGFRPVEGERGIYEKVVLVDDVTAVYERKWQIRYKGYWVQKYCFWLVTSSVNEIQIIESAKENEGYGFLDIFENAGPDNRDFVKTIDVLDLDEVIEVWEVKDGYSRYLDRMGEDEEKKGGEEAEAEKEKDGVERGYYADGRLKYEIYYSKGKEHRGDGPAYVKYYDNGKKEIEIYYRGGKVHREDGPAYIRYSYRGDVVAKVYYVDGKVHREGGPAKIEYYESGKVKEECYYREGKLHREDGPARVVYYEDGAKKIEEYYIEGKHHREGGPGYICYFRDGRIRGETYFKEGKRHREGGPANVWYYDNGVKEFEEYFKGGKLHREDGPAAVWWYKHGQEKAVEYCIEGKWPVQEKPYLTWYYEDGRVKETFYRLPPLSEEEREKYKYKFYRARYYENGNPMWIEWGGREGSSYYNEDGSEHKLVY